MYVLHAMPTTRGTRVAWALEEIGAEYRYVKVDLRSGEHLGDAFKALNPAARVPVLCDDDLVVTESAAIVAYLAERHPQAGLAPPVESRSARASYLQWSAFVACELEQPLWTLAKHEFALPRRQRVPAIAETARWEFARAAAVLALRLTDKEHLCGTQFTGADILAGHTLSWARNALGAIDEPVLDDYARRVLARPALARARERERSA